MTDLLTRDAMTPDGLEAALREMGAQRYHHLHPFHRRLHTGGSTRGEVEAWALNRYVYQAAIPRKDAALMARCEDMEVRRMWRHRLVDHDGTIGSDALGGLEKWLVLTDGLGLDRVAVMDERQALPGTRFATGAYVQFVRERSLLEAVASSLTEMFSPTVIAARVEGMLAHYPFVSHDTLAYFHARPPLAERDCAFALDYVKRNATTPEAQQAVLDALSFKLDVLWAMLDALQAAYGPGGTIPPGAFIPADALTPAGASVPAGHG